MCEVNCGVYMYGLLLHYFSFADMGIVGGTGGTPPDTITGK